MAKTIFLVDDSVTMLMSVKSTLEMNGFKVETAGDGLQALTKLKGGLKPDLIITDVNMPNMGGLELIKNVRTLHGFSLYADSDADHGKPMRPSATKARSWAPPAGWLNPSAGPDLIKVIKQVLPGS